MMTLGKSKTTAVCDVRTRVCGTGKLLQRGTDTAATLHMILQSNMPECNMPSNDATTCTTQ
jgi:hypothetical protein